jgi:hypothetical protein
VGIISASPLSMGLLTQRGPPTWHPAPPEVQEACSKAAAYAGSQGVDISKLALQYSVRWGAHAVRTDCSLWQRGGVRPGVQAV